MEADRSVAVAELDAIDGEVSTLIERAVVGAKASAPPAPADLYSDVYINY